MEPGSSVQCGRCGNVCQAGMRFCPRCGEPIAPPANAVDAAPLGSAYAPSGSGYAPAADGASWPPDPYATPLPPDPYAMPLPPDPYGASPLPDAYGAPAATFPYGAAQAASPYGTSPVPGAYGTPGQPAPYGAAPPGAYAPGYGPAPLDPRAQPYGMAPYYGPPRFVESVFRPEQLVTASPGRRLGAYLLDVVLLTVTLGIGWLIWFAFTAPRGQTPAKQLLNMYVLRRDGTRAGGWYMWLREFIIKDLLFWFINLMTVGVAWLIAAAFCLWDKDRQCLWDKVGSTYVAYSPMGFVPATARELREAAQRSSQTYLP